MLNTGTDDEVFRNYCERQNLKASPKVEDDTFVRPLLDIMAQQLSAFPAAGDPEHAAQFVRMGFIDRGSPNAFVDAWEGGACICLHSGLLLSITEAAIQLQDRIGAFDTDLAAASGENLTDPIGMTSFLTLLNKVDRDETLFEAPAGRDEAATWRATNFVSSGLQFVVLHEFAHVAFGHLGFLQSTGEPARLFEMDEEGGSKGGHDPEIRYFLEHEADVFALETLLRSALGRQLTSQDETYASGDEVFAILMSYLTTVFGWITLENELGRSSQSTHPLSFERLFALPMAVQGLLGEQAVFEGPLSEALNRCRVLLADVVPRYPRFASIARIFTPEVLSGIDRKIDWMRQMDEKTASRLGFRL